MFAVIKTGGKQYKVAADDVLKVERLVGEPGQTVTLESVLMVGGEKGVRLGAPYVEGATVAAEVVAQIRGEKIIVFKKKRRKNHRRRNGHRQDQTVLRVTEILTDGKTPAKTAKALRKPSAKKTKKTGARRAAPKAATPKKSAGAKAAKKED